MRIPDSGPQASNLLHRSAVTRVPLKTGCLKLAGEHGERSGRDPTPGHACYDVGVKQALASLWRGRDEAVLSRCKMYRGARPQADPLPVGIRQDTRKHTRHCLRPPEDAVRRYLAAPSAQAWREFEKNYLSVLGNRFSADSIPFNELAALAERADVFLGCSCPTKKNPDPRRCHTVTALRFMNRHFPRLETQGLAST